MYPVTIDFLNWTRFHDLAQENFFGFRVGACIQLETGPWGLPMIFSLRRGWVCFQAKMGLNTLKMCLVQNISGWDYADKCADYKTLRSNWRICSYTIGPTKIALFTAELAIAEEHCHHSAAQKNYPYLTLEATNHMWLSIWDHALNGTVGQSYWSGIWMAFFMEHPIKVEGETMP